MTRVDKVVGPGEVSLLDPHRVVSARVFIAAHVLERRTMPKIDVHLLGLLCPARRHVHLGEHIFHGREEPIVFDGVLNGNRPVPVALGYYPAHVFMGMCEGPHVNLVAIEALRGVQFVQKVKEVSPYRPAKPCEHDGILNNVVLEVEVSDGAAVWQET